MPEITLQNKFEFNNSTTDKNLLSFLQSSYDILLGMPHRILTTTRLAEWKDFIYAYPEQYKHINKEITDYAKHYLKLYRHYLFDLSGRYEIKLQDFEVEITTTDITNINNTVLLVYYYSKAYQLKEMCGSYLVLSNNEGTDLEENRCFMIEISDKLTIHTYEK